MENLALKFEKVVSGISSNLKKQGVEINSPITESEFSKLDPYRQAQLFKRASLQLEQMELIDPTLSPKDYIDTLCLYHRLRPSDPSVYTRLTDDMAWEILDFDFNQIYRNKLVYQLSNYCVSQMEENTPFELYERPKKVLEQLMDVVERIRNGSHLIDMNYIKPYVLKELKTGMSGMLQIQHDFMAHLC